MNKMCYIYKNEYCVAILKNKTIICITNDRTEVFMLSEINQAQKDEYHKFHLYLKGKKIGLTEGENAIVVVSSCCPGCS